MAVASVTSTGGYAEQLREGAARDKSEAVREQRAQREASDQEQATADDAKAAADRERDDSEKGKIVDTYA